MTRQPHERQRRLHLGERLALALLAAWSLLALELAVVAWGTRARITSIWELQHGAIGLTPAWVLVGAAGALLGWLLLELLAAPTWRRRAVLALGWALWGGAIGWGVGGGRHLAAPEQRWGFAGLVALLAAAAALAAAPGTARALRWARETRRRRILWSLGVALVVALVQLANLYILPRLYPAFHAGLSSLALALAALGWAVWFPSQSTSQSTSQSDGASRRWTLGRWTFSRAAAGIAVAVGMVAVAALALVPGARSVSGFDNLRWILLEHAPTLRWGVRLAATVAPPPPNRCQDASCEELPSVSAATPGGPTLDWSGRDIVLITVDALRADRLGATRGGRPLTPELDALAREGVVFEAAYAATPHTSYSLTSLMTGKYMRPLLLQGAGEDSDTWAGLLRTYGYRTAAFYPPAVFFIDTARFRRFEESRLDFEYTKVEFAEGEKRLGQIRDYLAQQPPEQRLFLWLHLFGPHEPYEAQPGYDFGARDVDRYDSEVAFADHTVGELVRMVRARSPRAVIVVTADHGEEFGEHGGRYHGTTVYEEQVRVPLVVVAPGDVVPGRVSRPVQTIDLLPTVLSALGVPPQPRIRGRDLSPLLARRTPREGAAAPDGSAAPPPAGEESGEGSPKGNAQDEGLAVAETEDYALLAEGTFRLICERRVGACQLFDLATDPAQRVDVSGRHPERFRRMRERSRQLAASHGEFESRGLRAEGRGWPAPILRGISGDGDAAPDLSELLDDADPAIRRKSAELLFELQRPETAGSLRLSLTRDEDPEVRRWAALALTRLGEGAPLVYELVQDGEPPVRRLAALALAETGDARGERELLAWWNDAAARDFERSRQLLRAFAKIRSEAAVAPLVGSLGDVRLRPDIARTLAAIGDKDARWFLVRALMNERYQSARSALVEAIVALGGKGDLVIPLVRFLGVPDPLQDGLAHAQKADILHHIGGPKREQLRRVRSLANSGVVTHLNVPPGGNGTGVRLVVRARARGSEGGVIYLQRGTEPPPSNSKDSKVRFRYRPTIEREKALEVRISPTQHGAGGSGVGAEGATEVAVTLPDAWRARPGHPFPLALFADQNVEVEALALVPLADELPPPPPEPWQPK